MNRRASIGAGSRAWRFGLCAALCWPLLSCGGGGGVGVSGSSGSGGSTPTGANVADVVVDAGPTSTTPDVNTLFTTVTVCVPGSTTNCQSIDHIQVDTGSYGLRILGPVLTVSLPVRTTANGASLLECTQFVDGYSWGPVALADVQISGESAGSVPVQIIGDANFTNVPADCSSIGRAEDTVAAFGANGILGIGVFAQDCGPNCVSTAVPATYYACTSTLCQATTVSLVNQVQNPVTLFAKDNNGVVVELPSVAAQGAATVAGFLIFGIDTQSNNKSGTQTVLTVDQNAELVMTFNGQTLAKSFIDSGSNAIFFADGNIAPCMTTDTGFYCPGNTLTLGPLSIQGQNGVMVNNLTFGVGNAQTMLQTNPNFNVLPELAGTLPTGLTGTFDYGLAFFYGKRVAVAVEGKTTSVGTGPYIAF